jgi:hypothetical protein
MPHLKIRPHLASSLSPLSTSRKRVGKVLDLLNDTNLERILITDNEAG